MNKAEHSRKIYLENKAKEPFNRPHELISALKAAKEELGKYPVYSGKRGADSFVDFLTERELNGFKAFDRKPRWKRYSKTAKHFRIEIADLYAGGVYPEGTPYSIDGFWTKKWGVCYTVDIFVDGGFHIHTEKINSKKPLPLKRVLSVAVENEHKARGERYDGYWY